MKSKPMNHRRGFTITEMMTAVAITSLMLLLIHQMFTQTQLAVSIGTATSDVIGMSRSVRTQFNQDFRAMIGPDGSLFAGTAGSGGPLVIVNTRLPNTTLTARQRVVSKRDSFNRVRLRCDMLGFFTDNPVGGIGAYPLCPGSEARFDNPTQGAVLKVWYGILMQTGGDGSTDNNINTLGGTAGANTIASDYILGRQAMHLINDPTSPAISIYAGGGGANAFLPGATVNGYGGNINAAIPRTVAYALTDVALMEFVNADAAVPDVMGPLGSGALLETGLPNGTYKTNALAMFYGTSRLRVNPLPRGQTFWSSQIAQMHAALLPHCSEFIVEFAADIVDDGAIPDPVGGFLPDDSPDRRPDADANNEIIWYSGFTNPLPVWAAGSYNNIRAGFQDPRTAVNPVANVQHGFVFRHDYPNYWPYMIRIRYRLHDRMGVLADHNTAALADQFDNNDNGIVDDEPEQRMDGKWFEQILSVARVRN